MPLEAGDMSYVNYFDGTPISDGWAAHRARGSLGGIDYMVKVGTPIRATCSGRVQNIPYNGTGGHTVTLWHGDGLGEGWRDQFMHCSGFVAEGYYNQGDIIGYSGGAKGSDGAGSSDGPHCHWHLINPSGTRVNPLDYVGSSGGLSVDGDFGPATTRALQRALGVTADGDFGPVSTRALQNFLGITADGDWGPQTTRALQAFLGVTVDGDFGPASTRALQERLNAGTFVKPAPTPVPEPAPAPAPEPTVTPDVTVDVTPIPEQPIVVEPTPTPEPVKEEVIVPVKPTLITEEQYKDVQDAAANLPKDAEDDLSQYDLASIGFWNYAGERVIKTFAMTFASLLSTTGAIVITAPESANIFAQIGWVYIASVSGVSALTSLLVALSSFRNIVTLKKKK